mmetsp:Transcript_10298/g.18585  ORF Transcript_10298/g.18585 Transcript_10298/m.18585 type:complete len:82 (-) Transcript_10298:854-1099(-)
MESVELPPSYHRHEYDSGTYNISDLVACNLNSRTIFPATDLSTMTMSVAGLCQEDAPVSCTVEQVIADKELFGSALLANST